MHLNKLQHVSWKVALNQANFFMAHSYQLLAILLTIGIGTIGTSGILVNILTIGQTTAEILTNMNTNPNFFKTNLPKTTN